MTHSPIWRAQPIFISSTFTDMMSERDVLRDYVFPELEERLRERRVRLEPIDLRWGVETTDKKEQEQKELTVLKVCLNEIDRCKPFFIGIIGDRYGWVPSAKRIKDAESEKGFESNLKDKSVTALEIEYGVLASKEQLQRSFFFFRDPLPYDQLPEEKRAEYADIHNPVFDENFARSRLDEFKKLIVNKIGRNRVFSYRADWDGNKVTGLDDFKKQILENLWKELDEQTKELEDTRSKTWQEEERKYLEDFVEERTICFSGREDVIKDLKEFALAEAGYDNCGLCLTGESGSGKSALFAKLYKELKDEDVLVLAHAAGISLRSNSITNMLTMWIEELAENLEMDISTDLKDKNDFDDLAKMYADLLSRTAVNKRVIILVDSLNQFERTAHARYVNWLPELLPTNAKFIFTAIAGEETNNLSKRKGINLQELNPVNLGDAEKIISIICSRYHKTLNPKAVKILLEKKREDGRFAYSNALWLTMAVDEFLLLDEDDFKRMKGLEGDAEQKLEQLLISTANELPAGISEMYNCVFERSSKFVNELSEAILCYIGISRYGLRENDLEQLINNNTNASWDTLDFATIRRYLRSHLVQRGENSLWDFRHLQARENLAQTMLSNGELVKKLHKNLATHLEALKEDDSLKLTEILWHLFKSDNKQQVAITYGTYRYDDYKTDEYSLTLKDILLENEKNLDWFRFLFELAIIDENVKKTINSNILYNLEELLKNNFPLKPRLKILLFMSHSAKQLRERNPDSVEFTRDLAISYRRIGDIYKSLGNTKSALESYKSWLKISEELNERDPNSIQYARDLAGSYNNIGNIYRKLGNTKSALESYEISLKIRKELHKQYPDAAFFARDLAQNYNDMGDIYTILGNMNSALEFYKSSLKITEELQRRDPDAELYADDLSVSYNRIGNIYTELGNTKIALESYKSMIKINKELLRRYPEKAKYVNDLAICYIKVGDIYMLLGNTKSALENYDSSLKIAEELQRQDPDSAEYTKGLYVSYNKIGDIYKALGNTKSTLENYESMLKIVKELQKRDPDSAEYARDLSISYDNVGNIYKALGNTKGALENYENSQKIREGLQTRNPDSAVYARDLAVSYDNVGDIYTILGNMNSALEFYKSSLKITEELRSLNPDSAVYKRDLAVSYDKIGDIYTALGNTKSALGSYESSLKIKKELRSLNPDSAEYERDLAVSYNRIGYIYSVLNNMKSAIENYEISVKIIEELRMRDPDFQKYTKDLLISYDKLGDIYIELGNTNSALENYEGALELREELRRRNPSSVEYARDLFKSYNRIANFYRVLDNTKSALENYESMLKIAEELLMRNPNSEEYARDLCASYNTIGDIYLGIVNTKSALESYESSLKIKKELRSLNPDSVEYARDLAVSYNNLGDIYTALGDTRSALQSYESSLKIKEELRKRNPDSAEYARDLWVSYWRMADINERIGDDSAKIWWRKSYETLNRMKLAGLFISKEDEKYLEVLRKKIE